MSTGRRAIDGDCETESDDRWSISIGRHTAKLRAREQKNIGRGRLWFNAAEARILIMEVEVFVFVISGASTQPFSRISGEPHHLITRSIVGLIMMETMNQATCDGLRQKSSVLISGLRHVELLLSNHRLTERLKDEENLKGAALWRMFRP